MGNTYRPTPKIRSRLGETPLHPSPNDGSKRHLMTVDNFASEWLDCHLTPLWLGETSARRHLMTARRGRHLMTVDNMPRPQGGGGNVFD